MNSDSNSGIQNGLKNDALDWFNARYGDLPLPTYLWRFGENDFELIGFNKAGFEATRGGIAKLLGEKANALFQDRPDILDDFFTCNKSREIIKREFYYRLRTTGENKYMHAIYLPVDADLIIIHSFDVSEQRESQLALEISEKKYKTLVESFPHGMAIHQDGRMAYVNPASVKMCGYDSAEELLKVKPLDLVVEPQRELVGALMIAHIQGQPEVPWNYETILLKKDGRQFPVEVYASAIQLNFRPAVQVVVIDITERKSAFEAIKKSQDDLRRSEAEYGELFNSILEGIAVVDERAVIQFCNPAFAGIFEEEKSQGMIGKNLNSYLNKNQQEVLRNQIEIRKSGMASQYELDILTVNGNRRTILASVSPRFDKHGGYTGAFGAVIDITESKRAMQALKESENKFRLLFENAGQPIFWVGYDGVFQIINGTAAAYLGGSPQDLVGKTMYELFPMEIADRQIKNIRAVIDSRKGMIREDYTILHGEKLWFQTTIQPIEDLQGNITSAQVVAINITDRRKREIRDRARLRLLEQLRKINKIDDCLDLTCNAIRESELYERAVMTLHNENREIINLGQKGVEKKMIEAARRLPAPDKELARRMTQPKYRISHSFFVPTEDGIFDSAVSRRVGQEKEYKRDGSIWQKNDELFIPIIDRKNRYIGWLSVDTPFDGNRPTLDVINCLEEIVDIASKKIYEIQDLQAITREQTSLNEKNIALNALLAHLEEEKMTFKKQVATDIEQIILPILHRLKKRDGSLNTAVYDTLKSSLQNLAGGAGGSIKAYHRLSPREIEICNLLKAGSTNKEIAEALGISASTVQKHREFIRRKLQLTNRRINLITYLKNL